MAVDPPQEPVLLEPPLKSRWVLVALICVCVLIEAVLAVSDQGWILSSRLRATAIDNGGFWPGLLTSWRPNYAAQPYTMFVTYGFLHSGLIHVAVNMITLWSLGQAVIERVGARGFAVLYGASLLGGALGFGLLAANLNPMVGASGALFGLAGGLLSWTYVDRFTVHERLWPVARTALFLLILNIVLWWAMDGQLAWETHLGGFLTGWAAAMLVDPRPRAVAHPTPGGQSDDRS